MDIKVFEAGRGPTGRRAESDFMHGLSIINIITVIC